MDNPILKLEAFGQSIWIDFIRRSMIDTGELARLIRNDGVSGVTSNPSIFEKAIAGSHDYDRAIEALALEGKNEADIYQALTIDDIQHVADLFRPLYDRLDGRDGFVSLEVSPYLAHDTRGTIEEARRLWKKVDRPNLMIKVPGTKEGLPAIEKLIGEGLNINITLLFGLPRYREVTEAYLAGLEALAGSGRPLARSASVASFFLSRIDVLLDPQLEQIQSKGGAQAGTAGGLVGEVAIASACEAYRIYQEVFGSERFRKLARDGARPQRVLWASTSTKNPQYSDVKYVEPLIGADTINTLPVETLNAYRDHGDPASRLNAGLQSARQKLEQLAGIGIDLDAATQQLEDEGVAKFEKAFEQLMDALKEKRAAAVKKPVDRQSFHLGIYQLPVEERLEKLQKMDFSARLWRKEADLWKSKAGEQESIRNALGWLHVAEKMIENLPDLESFAAQVREAGFRHAVVLGMGGSSLTPLVFQRSFPVGKNGLPLSVLDSTDPATILKLEKELPLRDTLFIVSSKSGTTTEPLAFGEYFFAQVGKLKGGEAGENFCAITDPGTPLVDLARQRGFRKTFINYADIGGRYSALSYFGLVPAALMGIDVGELLDRALRMVHACASCVPAADNPGVKLGAVLGELAEYQRDKVTFLLPESIASLGMWLEQLLAESTGKQGTGLLPVAGEPLGKPSAYGEDRVFVYIHPRKERQKDLEALVTSLRNAGQPVVTIQLDSLLDLGQEFFRWEVATAAAGAVLGIDPFDQPNVQESKDNTKRMLSIVRVRGNLPDATIPISAGALKLYLQEGAKSVPEAIKGFLAGARPGNYLAILADLPETPATGKQLESIRLRLRDRLQIATTLGYGPRYLHSTGQLHKGGPDTGMYLLLTADEADDMPVPGAPYTFGTLKQAQAQGDLQALRQHKRRVLRINLGADIRGGLAALKKAVEANT